MFRWGGGGVFKRRGAPWGGIGFGGEGGFRKKP